MSQRLDLEEQVREDPAPAPDDPATGTVADPADPARAAVFPAPLVTIGAGAVGATVGFAAVYLLAALQVNPLVGVAVIVILFALALVGPKILADATTETGRAIAVVLDSLAFGGTFAGLVVVFLL